MKFNYTSQEALLVHAVNATSSCYDGSREEINCVQHVSSAPQTATGPFVDSTYLSFERQADPPCTPTQWLHKDANIFRVSLRALSSLVLCFVELRSL